MQNFVKQTELAEARRFEGQTLQSKGTGFSPYINRRK